MDEFKTTKNSRGVEEFEVKLKINVEWILDIKKAMKTMGVKKLNFFMNSWMESWFDENQAGALCTENITLVDELKAFAEYKGELRKENEAQGYFWDEDAD